MNSKARLLVKAAAYEIERRQRLRFAIKQACSMEKDAAGAGKIVGRWTGRLGNMVARKGAPQNFAQRLGRQMEQTGLRNTAKSGLRRLGETSRTGFKLLGNKMPLTHDLIAGMGERGKSYFDALTGREARKFMEGRSGSLMDLARPGFKTLAHGRAGQLQELKDLASAATSNTTSDALGRQAARIARRQFRTRLGTAGVGTAALGYGLFGGEDSDIPDSLLRQALTRRAKQITSHVALTALEKGKSALEKVKPTLGKVKFN